MAISHIQMGSGDPIAITLPGLNASVTELNYSAGVTSSIQNQLNGKMNDYSLSVYNGASGNPRAVRFATINYSTCTSEAGVMIRIGMVSGHGNGISYTFLQDAIISVSNTGSVAVDVFKYYGQETPEYDGQIRQYGDIFWTINTDTKIVELYCLMGQWATVNLTPPKRLNASSAGVITMPNHANYSSGEKFWANNSDIALMSDLLSYYTKEEANEQINNSANTTKQWVEGKGYLTSNSLSGYATEQWVTNKGYLTSSSLTNYATKKYADDGVGAAKGYTDTKISNLMGVGTPETLDTLWELSQALKDDPNTVTVLENAIATKANAATTLSGYGITDAYTKTETNNIMSSYLPLSGGTMSGTIDFSDRATWITPYLLAFKNAEPSNSATYPYTGFYQWGNEWQVNARDANNTFAHNILSINLDSKVARFEAVPNVAGVNVALTNQIPTTLKNPYSLTIQGNGVTLDTYDGSAAKTINLSAEHFNAYTKTEVGNLLDAYVLKSNTSETMIRTDYNNQSARLSLKSSGAKLTASNDLEVVSLNVGTDGIELAGNTTAWSLTADKLHQGITSSDTSLATMNRFQSDLYIQGDGSAPNNPRVAGFYLGKSTTDDNRHMDIVSGGNYSYIDFNQANAEVDYNVRLIANVESGFTEFQWGGAGADKTLNVAGTLKQAGQLVATQDWVAGRGYLTSLPSHNHDDRYYTEAEADNRFVNASGDTMSGALTVNSNITASGTVKVGNAVTLQYNSSNACLDFIF